MEKKSPKAERNTEYGLHCPTSVHLQRVFLICPTREIEQIPKKTDAATSGNLAHDTPVSRRVL